jgi:hypothetical protein
MSRSSSKSSRDRRGARGTRLIAPGAALLVIATAASAGDPCGTGGSCFEAHPAPGCSQVTCCDTICGIDPFCCETSWDTACAKIAELICAPPVNVLGFEHNSLGNGAIAAAPGGGVVVTNLGSSGLDGVSIDIGAARGLALDLNWDPLPTSGSFTLRQIGAANDLLGSMTVTFGSETFVYEADFSPQGASGYTLTALLDGEVVLEVPGLSGAAISHAAVGFSAKPPGKWKCFWKPCAVNKCDKWGHSFADATIIDVVGVGPVLADGFSVTPTGACDGGNSVSAIEVLGTDLDSIQINAEYIELFSGIFNQPVGETALVGIDETLVVSPASGAGPFGVRTWPGAGPGVGSVIPTAFSIGWLELSDQASAGSMMRFSSTGRVGGISGVPLGTLTMTRPDEIAGVTLVADYSSIGSTSQQAIVYLGDAVVATISGNTGPITVSCAVGLGDWKDVSDHCKKGKAFIDGQATACYRPGWSAPVKFTFINGSSNAVTSFIGDSIAVLAESPLAPFEGLESFDVELEGFPELTLVNSQFSLVTAPCPPDLTLDGTVDAADLAVLLGQWGRSGSADVTGDGLVDASDLAVVLGAWGPCS